MLTIKLIITYIISGNRFGTEASEKKSPVRSTAKNIQYEMRNVGIKSRGKNELPIKKISIIRSMVDFNQS